MTSKICPFCNGKIPEEKIREFESKFKAQESKIIAQQEEKHKERMEEENKRWEKELKRQKESTEDIIKLLEKNKKQEIERKEKEYKSLLKEKTKNKDVEISSYKKKLAKLESEKEKITEKIRNEVKVEMNEQIKQKDNEITSLKQKHLAEDEKLKIEYEAKIRQLENKTPDEFGVEGQAEVLNILNRDFPRDVITETKRGKAGSDIFHKIIYNGEEAGLIVYEIKNVSNWKNDFVEQVKEEKIKHNAHYAMLVSNVFPTKEKMLCVKDGVIVVCPSKAVIIAREVRNFLIESHKAKLTGEQIEEKIKILQEYLTSPEYKNTFSDLANTIKEWHDIREKEKTFHERHWVDESNLNEKIARGTTKIYAKIASIIETNTSKIPIAISYQHPKKLRRELYFPHPIKRSEKSPVKQKNFGVLPVRHFQNRT